MPCFFVDGSMLLLIFPVLPDQTENQRDQEHWNADDAHDGIPCTTEAGKLLPGHVDFIHANESRGIPLIQYADHGESREEETQEDKDRAKKFFPSYGTELAATRLGVERFKKVVERLENDPESRELVCECENVPLAEVEEMAAEFSSFQINDIRRRTRIGMGTCQGNFCALRSAGVFAKYGKTPRAQDTLERMKEFLQGRWKGIRPVLVGRTLRETEMTRALYELSFHVNGGED